MCHAMRLVSVSQNNELVVCLTYVLRREQYLLPVDRPVVGVFGGCVLPLAHRLHFDVAFPLLRPQHCDG
jgi:hypothetical protein